MAAKILVIENDPDYQAILREILTSGGYEVVLSDSGVDGLNRVKESNPDLIILDVMMESTISGFEVANRLKSKDPASAYAAYARVPILILTAIHQSTSFRFRPDEEYIPVEDFMEKPPAPDELLKRVKLLLDLHR
jgi:CheY-like chemotaxis protein